MSSAGLTELIGCSALWNAMSLNAMSLGSPEGGAPIALSVLGLNLLGDGLRDLLDPTLRGR